MKTIPDVPANGLDVLLINMPFGPLLSPSIGLSLIRSGLRARNINARIEYFSLKFAKLIGTKLYSAIASGAPINHDLVGEWIFASDLFEQSSETVKGFVNEILRGQHPAHSKEKYGSKIPNEDFITQVLSSRAKVQQFLDQCLSEVISQQPKIVGFTSVFQQQLASLALAKRIKSALPDTIIFLGGANNEGKMGMEYVRQFDFIDAVFSGEGDFTFPEVVEEILSDHPFHHIKGVICKNNLQQIEKTPSQANAPLVRDMDGLPFLNYDDYFQQYEQQDLEIDIKPRLLFETSRGCWWGEIKHCTFCGLNGHNMKHRSKSAYRALSELNHLSTKYPGHPISVVDNILDMKYFKDLIPALAAQNNPDLELFYEVKANLNKRQIAALKTAGISIIQPGIESLSDQVLKIMEKGVSAIQNIQLLKWCKELGVRPEWNILWGFPGEAPEEYEKMAAVVPLLTHLTPPGSAGPIRLDRFSPNFNSSAQLGFTDVTPFPTYRYIFPFAAEILYNLAYYFTFRYQQPVDTKNYTKAFRKEIEHWKANHSNSDLFSVDKEVLLMVWDFRPIARKNLFILREKERFLYLACDKMKTIRQLQNEYLARTGIKLSLTEIDETMQQLVENALCYQGSNHYLSLAVPIGHYSPNHLVLTKLDEAIKTMGEYSEAKGQTVIKV